MKTILSTADAPAAIGPYSQAVRSGEALYCSGQLGIDPANIRMFDSKGILHKGRTDLNKYKAQFALSEDMTMTEALKDADLFLGLSKKDLLTPDMIKGMADHPVIFACANPDPEIAYPLAMETRPDCIMGTGRTDFPNQINNVLVFPGVFKGALSVRAKEITELMKQRASYAIASMIPDEELTPENIIASPLNKKVADVVAKAVADTAIEEGIARV